MIIVSSVFDHLSLGVSDVERAGAFYDAVLAPLGLVRVMTHPRAVGYGPPGYMGEAPFVLLFDGNASAGRGTHVAFRAHDRAAVDGFHAAAMQRGAVDEGEPGVRAHYDAGYYAAFVRDLDGHRLEAVFHEPTA